MKGVRAGYLPQDILELPRGTLVESVLAAVPDRGRLTERLHATEAALSRAQDDEERVDLAQQLADVHEELRDFEERYGRHQAERILAGLGFSEKDLGRDTATLSGGWKMRAALAGLLLMGPDLLLLDEPTNHLDIPSLLWFDAFLARSAKALLLVCHDRDFLNRHIDRVLSFEMEGLRGYGGNYEDYRRQREAEEVEIAARARRQDEKRAETEAFIDRFRAKATKARQVQSRIKMLEKQEVIRTLETRATVRFRFPEVPRSGREVVRLSGLTKRFGEKEIYSGVDGTVLRGDRVAIIGVNGAGKTTLLKILAGELAADAGSVTLGHSVQPAYYAQHHTELLGPQRTILDEIWSLVPSQPQSFVRGVLGSFLFSGDDVEKRIGVLSGGERARVSLARLLVLPSNLLLMDEPTNHLDLASSEQLIEALKGYGGTLLFVSHNKSFVNQLATRVWDVKGGTIADWPGNLDDYLHHLSLGAGAPETSAESETGSCAVAESQKERRRREAQEREASNAVLRPVREAIERLEEQIGGLEEEQRAIELQLADPGLYQDFARAKPLMAAFNGNREALEDLYRRWEEAQRKLAELSPPREAR
jgi:ATP-binding cassette subfamily F protein 3